MNFSEVAVRTDTGKVRDHNEDAVLQTDGLVALSDGMGGHDAGEVASATAIAVIQRHAPALAQTATRSTSKETVAHLEEVFQEAADAVEAEGAKLNAKIGCTLVVAVLGRHAVFVGHVGDSRAYLLRARRLIALTTDHNVYETLIQRGVDATKAAAHPAAPRLVQALGMGPVNPDVAEISVGREDTLLVCSDGLHDFTPHGDIADILGREDAAKVADELIDLALDHGAPDNVSVCVARVKAEVSSRRVARRTDRLKSIPLFRNLDEAQLTNVVPFMRTIRFRSGDVLMKEGDQGDDCVILLEGSARITKGDIVLVEVGAGGCFGEMALTGPWKRSATVTATEAGIAATLSREGYDALCGARPEIAIHIDRALSRNLANRMADLTERLALVKQAADGKLNTPA